MRRFFVGGNWKMNGDSQLVEEFAGLNAVTGVDVVIFPPAPLLTQCKSVFPAGVAVGAQNCHNAVSGAFTGEVSPRLLASLKVPWVLLGHSERRKLFGEADELIALKLETALQEGLRVVLCVGETAEERASEQMNTVLRKQLSILAGVEVRKEQLVVAYEPVWAIGTGQVATPAQAASAHAFLRNELKAFGLEDCRIIYGGSVTAASAPELAQLEDVDGFLVGGASLKLSEFNQIISHCK